MLKIKASSLEQDRARLLNAAAYEQHVEDEASKH
jgi:hypothetical protein